MSEGHGNMTNTSGAISPDFNLRSPLVKNEEIENTNKHVINMNANLVVRAEYSSNELSCNILITHLPGAGGGGGD